MDEAEFPVRFPAAIPAFGHMVFTGQSLAVAEAAAARTALVGGVQDILGFFRHFQCVPHLVAQLEELGHGLAAARAVLLHFVDEGLDAEGHHAVVFFIGGHHDRHGVAVIDHTAVKIGSLFPVQLQTCFQLMNGLRRVGVLEPRLPCRTLAQIDQPKQIFSGCGRSSKRKLPPACNCWPVPADNAPAHSR